MQLRRNESPTQPAAWSSDCGAAATFRRSLACTLSVLLGLATLTSVGCSGCNSKNNAQGQADGENQESKQQAADKKKKDPREIKPLLPLIG
ncbi:MAG: hypothetical protein AAGD11_10965, partial [Planctomycetota bacterium]